MISVEFCWLILVLVFAVIGAARGLGKELGTAAIVALSLFALWLGWDQAGNMVISLIKRGPFKDLRSQEIKAIYYSLTICFIAFISYEGITLLFPIKLKGILKNAFGFLGGLVNGYLIVGTIWNVAAQADYFLPQLKVVQPPFSDFHNTIVKYLPVSLMEDFSPIPMLMLGMLLLLAVIFK
jgi:uncharacterized membrane protein required for colicin V production